MLKQNAFQGLRYWPLTLGVLPPELVSRTSRTEAGEPLYAPLVLERVSEWRLA